MNNLRKYIPNNTKNWLKETHVAIANVSNLSKTKLNVNFFNFFNAILLILVIIVFFQSIPVCPPAET